MNIPDKISIKFTGYNALPDFEHTLSKMIEELMDAPTPAEKLVGVNLSTMIKRVAKKRIDGQRNTSISFTASEAIAFTYGYQLLGLDFFDQYERPRVIDIVVKVDKAC